MLATQWPSQQLSSYEERAECFWQQEVSALYRTQAGLASGRSLARIYADYADLFSPEQLPSLIEAARTQANSQYRLLAEFAVMRCLRQTAVSYDDAFFTQLGQSSMPWDGDVLPFFAITGRLAAEPDAARRRLLYEGRSQLVARHNSIRQQRLQATEGQSRALGFDSYYALCNELRGLRLVTLQFMAQRFLKETAVPYFHALARWSQTILGMANPDAADMFYLLRAAQFDALFPRERLESTVYNASALLGISLEERSGLQIDLEMRPGKSVRPFSAFVQVPGDIKLVVNPAGGHQDYKAVFHELGHALHGLHIPAHLPFATRYLGDESVGEAFAFLFEQLPTHPVWLRQLLGLTNNTDYIDYMRFIRLLFVRRCAAKVLYESQLYTGAENPEALYASLLQEHLGLNISAAYYLLDVDDGFYNAQYFRAWILAAQLAAQLTAHIGDEWVTSPATGAFLQPLWRKGQPAAEIMAVCIGQEGLNPEALIRTFQG